MRTRELSPKLVRMLTFLQLAVLSGVAYAQSDVTQPGDPVIASSSNSPGSEGVANAIDNTQAKYLNFDTRNPNNPPSGFAVSPSVGVTRVIGMSIQAANDAPERDPATVVLEGSNDDAITNFNSGNWTFIAGVTNITPWRTVFPDPDPTDNFDPSRFQTQTFFFDNFQPYRHYRWTVVAVSTNNGCCMQVAEVELLGSTLPPDVTQPGDLVVASSSNSPGSEGVANAIDNTQAKYLNFDTRNPNNPPSGFTVTPSIGKSLVTGMTIQAANDAPERDPSTVVLEGSNDDAITNFNSGNWTFIAGVTNITPWRTLFPDPDPTDNFDPSRFETQTFLFDNFRPFKHYRWTVVAVSTNNGCCMQVAEVELLGTGAPKDVTQPGDPVIASSSNSPGSEGVANAIDNTQAKYLNFDTRNPNNPPSGFAVTPSIGSSVVIGMTIQAANDAPERDPSTVILEGSNDNTITNFTSGNWTFVAGISNITPWRTLFPDPDPTDNFDPSRFQIQEFFFPNKQSFKHYRWTVLAVSTNNGCCMQVAEVELLAATQSNPCGQTAFTQAPVDTPALIGSPATFLAKVNGPWTVQWLRNDLPIPGANTLSYSTPPMTAAGDTNLYSLAIVGCQTSQVVRATLFTPSATKSIGINFRGGGANGSPTDTFPDDIAGIQLQAYWNNATNSTGATGDGASLPNAVVDSDNQPSTITVDFAANNTWGAGTGTDSPTERTLNGLVHTANAPGTPARITFGNVPAGNHAVIVYLVGIPLQFQNADYWITGTTSVTNYVTVMNSDQYKPAPGFYRGSSTNPNARTLANFVRFDNVQPSGGAGGTIELGWDTATTGGGDRGVPVNAIQLVLNAPNPGAPPAITADPQPTVAQTNGTVVLTVTATGNNLTYQWRKNGVNLSNGGNVSGATTSTLTIGSFSDADVGIYSVAVFNPAGSVISKNASVRVSRFSITDRLVGHWKLDETTGTLAANAASGGLPGYVTGTPTWVAGRIANAFSFDGATYMIVSNYTKATKGIAASAWVNIPAGGGADMIVIQNAQPALTTSGGAGRIVGQFQLGLVLDVNDSLMKPMAAVGIGPNVARATGTAAFPTGWHHLAFSADGAQLRVYVDGQEVASSDYLADINPPDIPYLSLGAALNAVDPNDPSLGVAPDGSAPNFLTGPADDVGLWTRALTADEISRVFQAGQQGQALNTVVITPPVDVEITSATLSGGNITIQWTGGGTLFSAPTVTGPWTTTGDSDGSFSESATGTKFYRVQQ